MTVSPPSVSLKQRLKERLVVLMSSGLRPVDVGWAAALGGCMAVAPLPGLQMLVGVALAVRLRLNIAVVVVFSNLSFGPLLPMWWSVAIVLGRWLRSGQSPEEAYAEISAQVAAAEGMLAMVGVCGDWLVDWLLGCVVLMAALAAVCGGLGFGVATVVQRARLVRKP